jgi:parallel beta-helix repeat protein
LIFLYLRTYHWNSSGNQNKTMHTTMRRNLHFLFTTSSLLALQTFGAQIHVPLDQPTIQLGINAAVNGDTVLVSPGTYNESLTIASKDIVVISTGGPAVTVIDSHRTNRVATLTGSMGRSTRLDGFTLRNGNGGVLVNGPSATIANNIIITNANNLRGMGMDIEFSSPLVISNTITGNFVSSGSGQQGGGIYVGGAAAAEIVHNVISNNSPGGITLFAAGTPILRENVITANTSGNGISLLNYADALIINNVIANNRGDGINGLVPSGNRGPYILNNTIVDNQGNGILSDGFDKAALIANNIVVTYSTYTALYIGNFDPNQPIIKNNDLYAPFGTPFGGLGPNPIGANGNISIDPSFVSYGTADYHLGSASLCINSGESSFVPSTITNDFDGLPRIVGSVDLGAFEVQNPGSIISYVWLQAHGLPYDGSADFADPDSDGMNNWQEWRCDTDPFDPASVLKILSVSRAANTNTVTWQSVNTRSYYLQRATNLAAANPFTTIATNLAGQPVTTAFNDNAPGSSAAFYRVYVR